MKLQVMEKLVLVVVALIFVAFTATVSVAGGPVGAEDENTADTIPELMPGILIGYLPAADLPNSLKLLPPPPVKGSAALKLDNEISQRALQLRGTTRWQLAKDDANLMFPQAAGTFSCALNAPITEKQTPHLYMLLRRTLADAGFATYAAKKHYQRTRPFMQNNQPICTPEDESRLRHDGSYPSGHTAFGWAWGLILSEIAPERTEFLIARAEAFGESRVICNVHWYSDMLEGRVIGSVAVAKLHANSDFMAELTAAKLEYQKVHDQGLKPTRDCQTEANALAITLD